MKRLLESRIVFLVDKINTLYSTDGTDWNEIRIAKERLAENKNLFMIIFGIENTENERVLNELGVLR